MQQEETKGTNIKKELLEWVKAIAIAVVLTLFVTQVLVVNAKIPSGSMENTIMTGDHVLGIRPAYWFANPVRGDIVIFKFPDDETTLFVKRVVGLPGDTVEIRSGKVYINGSSTPLEEPYLKEPPLTKGPYANGMYTVPENCYFVLGDNRNDSLDSRYWKNTFVEKGKIIGKGWVRIFPHPGFLH